MRLLYVTERVPNRDPTAGDGSSMIPYEVLLALPPSVSISLVTFRGDVPVPVEVRARCESVVELPMRSPALSVARALMSRPHRRTEERSTRSARRLVRAASSAHDVTLLHGPHVTFLAHEVHGPVVLQIVDPWSLRVELQAELAAGRQARFLRRKARQALVLERRLPARARLLTVGRRDADTWSALLGREVRHISNGVGHAGMPRSERAGERRTVCFVGSLNYAPNIESAILLIEQIAPLVWEAAPHTRFVLAGRQPTPEVLALAGDRVEVLANVPDLQEVYRAADVAVFPDRHGLGVRNSVREALASGLPVVASTIAARGQESQPQLRVGDSVSELVELALRVLRQPVSARPVGPAASSLAADGALRTWKMVADDYRRVLELAVQPAA